jgi:hypothetical protein
MYPSFPPSAFRLWLLLPLLLLATPENSFGAPKTAPARSTPQAHQTLIESAKPLLQRFCLDCHNPDKAKGDVDIASVLADPDLLKNRAFWRDVIKQTASAQMPPAKADKKPTHSERSQITDAINASLSAAIAALPPDPGAVTMRRLNRTEYNQTIRDLLLVDINASEAFPADDIGAGFDNIGEVLTLSPVHAERFLDAASNLALRALPLKEEPERHKFVRPQSFEPGGFPEKPSDRPFDNQRNTLATNQTFDEAGVYRLSISVSAEGAFLSEAPLLEVYVDGSLKGTHEVTSPYKNWKSLDLILPLSEGSHRFEFRFANPDSTLPERMIFAKSATVTGPKDRRTRFQRKVAATLASLPQNQHPEAFTEWFLTRAFRRPPTPDEKRRYLTLFTANAEPLSFYDGARAVVTMALCSPHFVFRPEPTASPKPGMSRLSEVQLASRLSYFLWSSMPDDELLTLATKGQLQANLDTQINRMLADPKASTLVSNFGMQWLQLQRFSGFMPDTTQFPLNETLRRSMLKETELFLSEVFLKNRPVTDLVSGQYTFLNETLAQHYGLADTSGNPAKGPRSKPAGTALRGRDFQRVDLSESPRSGILTHASVLAVTSNPTRTSPVKRGKWVLEQIMGTPPPPPPPNVPELEANKEAKGTLRQRMEMHRENPACANCHQSMDAIGFALENFDVIGRFRDADAEGPIDPSGKLPDGTAFSGMSELKDILSAKQDVIVRNVTEKLMTYALGRSLDFFDDRPIQKIVADAAQQENRFHALIKGIIKSDPFLFQRGMPGPKVAKKDSK